VFFLWLVKRFREHFELTAVHHSKTIGECQPGFKFNCDRVSWAVFENWNAFPADFLVSFTVMV